MIKNRIAVFDVNTGDCTVTAEAVRDYYGADKVQVEKFTDMQDFVQVFGVLNYFSDEFEAVFLSMDGMLGVEAGRNMRELNRSIPLFCVSNSGDYLFEAHRLHALDYLVKPVSSKNVGEAEERIRRNRKRKF